MKTLIRVFFKNSILLLSLIFIATSAHAESSDIIIKEGNKRNEEGIAAQNKIDTIDDQTQDLSAQYSTTVKIVDGLKVYNKILEQQIQHQYQEMAAFKASLKKIIVVERQILPLIIKMIDSLDEFIKTDTPFLKEERTKRVKSLQAMIVRSDISSAEKFRKVIEAYEIENEYGRTIEAYKGNIVIEGSQKQVDFLRIGRVTLMYQSLDKEDTGIWNKKSSQWESVSAQTYRQQMQFGLKVARKQVAPDLLVIPVAAATEAK